MYRLELFLVSMFLLAAQNPQSGQKFDVKLDVDRARVILEEDYDALGEYEFERHVRRQKLDKSGSVTWSTAYHFDVTPQAPGFDEQLVEIDGREPTQAEIAEHREAKRFEKRHETRGSLKNPFGRDISVLPLLFEQRHEYVGRRVVRGQPCHKTKFSARNPPTKMPARRRLTYVLEGEACFSVNGNHVVEAEMETTRSVSSGVVTLHFLRVRLELEPAGDGNWLPSRFEVRSDVRIGLSRFRKSNVYRYTNPRRPER